MYVCSEGFGESINMSYVPLNSVSEREREREREREIERERERESERERERESISRLPLVVFLWIKGRCTGL